jgi:hypothetical protein
LDTILDEEVESSSKVRSFRINSDLDEQFTSIIEKEGYTTSSFLNRMVKVYVDYLRYLKDIGTIIISKTSIKGFLKYLTEEECKENGLALGSKMPVQMLLLSGSPRSIKSLDVVMDNLGNNSGWFTPTFHGKGKDGYWYIQNTLGTKWRYFLEGYFTGMVEALGADVKTEVIGDNLIVRII